MVKVGFDSNGGEYADPIRYDLGHEQRYTGVISKVSDIYTKENQFEDEEVEQLNIDIRTDLDDLDVDEETREGLRDYIEGKIEEYEEEGLEYDHPEGAVESTMYPTAKVTPGTNDVNSSKLFETLKKVGLAEAGDDGDVILYDRDGNEVDPFEEAEDDPQAMNDAFVDYLRANLTGMKVTYELRNVNRDSDDVYSVVNKIIELKDDPEAGE